jgi:hypothetical protein
LVRDFAGGLTGDFVVACGAGVPGGVMDCVVMIGSASDCVTTPDGPATAKATVNAPAMAIALAANVAVRLSFPPVSIMCRVPRIPAPRQSRPAC